MKRVNVTIKVTVQDAETGQTAVEDTFVRNDLPYEALLIAQDHLFGTTSWLRRRNPASRLSRSGRRPSASLTRNTNGPSLEAHGRRPFVRTPCYTQPRRSCPHSPRGFLADECAVGLGAVTMTS